jgi:hypothetical protein
MNRVIEDARIVVSPKVSLGLDHDTLRLRHEVLGMTRETHNKSLQHFQTAKDVVMILGLVRYSTKIR